MLLFVRLKLFMLMEFWKLGIRFKNTDIHLHKSSIFTFTNNRSVKLKELNTISS